MASEKFWEFAERTAKEVENWPEWKKKAVGYPIKKSKMETLNEEKIKALQEYITEIGKMLSVNWNGNSTDKVVQSALSETLEELKRLQDRVGKLEKVYYAASGAADSVGDSQWKYPLILALLAAAQDGN